MKEKKEEPIGPACACGRVDIYKEMDNTYKLDTIIKLKTYNKKLIFIQLILVS